MDAYCPTSRFRIAAEESPLRCPITSDPLEYTGFSSFEPRLIDAAQPGLWRYAAMLPVVAPGQMRITLGEGWTPLVPDRWAGIDLYWKYEALMPTGSYKDRGFSLMINWLVRQGAMELVEDSSGNAGASLACYASRAGLSACIYVPEGASAISKHQISSYGAELVEVPGQREAASRAATAASRMLKNVKYASHAWHPAFLLGQMTCAWELWEQLGRRIPDWYIVPVGNGGALLGAWRGFQHLRNSGVTTKLPRLLAVQAEPYTPLYDAFHNDLDVAEPSPGMGKILADGIAVSKPARSPTLLSVIRRSRGTVVAVTDVEVERSQHKLAEQGIFVEPTSAAVAAAIAQIMKVAQSADTMPLFRSGEIIVAALTGHGLKSPPI